MSKFSITFRKKLEQEIIRELEAQRSKLVTDIKGYTRSWKHMPVIDHYPEPSITYLSWECIYCGRTNEPSAVACRGCGANVKKSREDDIPRGCLYYLGWNNP